MNSLTNESSQPKVREELIAARAKLLLLNSPYHYIRELSVEAQQARYGTQTARHYGQRIGEEVLPMFGADGQWLLQKLAWDTEYFGIPTYKLFTGLFDANQSAQQLAVAAATLRRDLAARNAFYAFSIVPAEDLKLLQALTSAGWQLIETRLNFYCPVAEAILPKQTSVRLARADEVAHIGQISALARNPYDRFHADPWFGQERADTFLAHYAEATVSGDYADAVLLPDEPGMVVDSFLAIGDYPATANFPDSGASRVLLTAVGPQNKGWHVKLVAETIRRAASLSFPYVLMTTQATNKAVFRTCEKLSFRLGSISHVLACNT